MQDHWNLGRWGRVPVTMHWTVLLAFPWLYLWMKDLPGALIGTLAFFALLVAHEFGHVFVARWRGIPVYAVNLSGMHGETERGHPRTMKDEVIVAWAGVGAQLLVLLLALIASRFLATVSSPLVATIAAPILIVWTQWNIFLMIVALLPIGPMDGHSAWKIIPLIRGAFRPKTRFEKVVRLTPKRQRELHEDSANKVVEIIDRLQKKK